MTKKKALEPSAFATSGSAAAAQPAKASILNSPQKKASRPRQSSAKVEALPKEVALPADAQLESTTRASQPKAPRANSTAVTHRHKKLEIAAPVAELETLRAEISHAPVKQRAVEPTNEEIAKLAYSYYVARGYQPGNQADDWFRAVSELSAKLKA